VRAMPMLSAAAATLLACAAIALASPSEAKTLRWSGQGDPQTMDPYSQNEGLTNNINQHIYERLVDRDRQLNIVPGLATSWQQLSDTVWRFSLRKGVRFHDGAPFTADDVVFSIERAQHPNSQIAQYALALGKPVKIDDFTVELRQERPNPILLQHADAVFIMSKAWCVRNKVERPLDFKSKEETFAARNANGTGPYVLKSREPGVRTVMTRNPNWWNRHEGNVDEVVYAPISADATRVAALLSGEIDLLQDPPPQDMDRLANNAGTRVINGMENRIVFFGFDQARDELAYSNVRGRNPFKDRRVREAFYRAIDIEAIKAKTMRGQSMPTGCMTPSPLACVDKALEPRLPYDRELARKLLADAGYPAGFEVTLDCPNNRYVNDEKICVAAAAMLSQIGVTVRVNAMPKTTYFPKLEKGDTSFYMLGWGGAVTDAQTIIDPVLHTRDDKTQKGFYNYGRYADSKLDASGDAAASEMNPDKRRKFIADALRQHSDEVRHIPLHRQVIPWAMRANVKAVHRADNFVISDWIRID
jgi:peptide/nickel transport system substrate-binding protein